MSDQLQFLQELAKALDAPDSRGALRAALSAFRGPKAPRRSQDELQQYHFFLAELAWAWGLAFEVARDGRVVGSIEPAGGAEANSLRRVSPGRYTIRLSTGMLVWEGRVTREDTLWVYAHRGQEVTAAADTDTGEELRRPSRSEALLGGTATMELLPGMDAGTMRIRLNG